MTPVIAETRILLVEDYDPLRTAYRIALAEAGYAVTEAAYGERAVELIREHGCSHYDLVITDYLMGGEMLTGGEAVNAIRQKCPDQQVLYVSGCDLPADLRKNEAFLQKPVELDRLIAEVARLIRSTAATIPPGEP